MKTSDQDNMDCQRKYAQVIILLLLLALPFTLLSQELDSKALDRYISSAVSDFKVSGLSIAVIKDNENGSDIIRKFVIVR